MSVVIPIYNDFETLPRAVESVHSQDITDLEVVIVDDGSTDGRRFESPDGCAVPVRVVKHDFRRGAGAARNTGVAAARGEFVAFLDADDQWLPQKLRQQLKTLEETNTSVNCCSYFLCRSDTIWTVTSLAPARNWIRNLFWGCHLSPGSTLVIRRSVFEEVGGFDEMLPRLEDWDLLLRIAESHAISITAPPLARIFIDDPPPSAAVSASLAKIYQKHFSTASRHGARQRLRAAILLERAAVEYRDGRLLKALALAVGSFVNHPGRNWRFYRRMAAHVARFRGHRRRTSAKRASDPENFSRVLHVTTGLDIGGAEGALVSLVEGERPESRPIGAVSLTGPGSHGAAIVAGGVPVFALQMPSCRVSVRGILRLALLIRRLKPEIVQSWMYHADLVSLVGLYLSGRRHRTKLVWGIRCSDMDFNHYSRLLRLVVRLSVLLSRFPNAIIANSERGRDSHLILGYRPRHFFVVHNGVDMLRFKPDSDARAEIRRTIGIGEDEVTIIHVARIDPMKDHHCLLEALARVRDARGVLVGRGTERIAVPPSIVALGLRSDMPALYASADIVISSSAFGEGFPNAIAEGMAAGLPVVATDVGDTRALVGDCGMIVPPRSPAALAAALQELIDDSARRVDLGRRARHHYSLDTYVRRFGEAYSKIP